MVKVAIFGGTTEGRELCEFCERLAIHTLYCVATIDGARAVKQLPCVDARVGRLDAAQMTTWLEECDPDLVVDATHPYAQGVSRNIEAACRKADTPMLRVIRETAATQGSVSFNGIDDLLLWIEQTPGNVFVATGASLAGQLTRLTDYRSRIWLRILPSPDSLRACLDLGYLPERLICMQGPFTQELNHAMLKATGAKILVTKNSGAAGGFAEKISAAQKLGIVTAVLKRPEEPEGVLLEEAQKRIMELRI